MYYFNILVDVNIYLTCITLVKGFIHQSYFFLNVLGSSTKILIFLGFEENLTLAIEEVTFLDTNICLVCMYIYIIPKKFKYIYPYAGGYSVFLIRNPGQ